MTVEIGIRKLDGPFDPGDPYQAMCETFRRQVVDTAAEAYKITIYRDLTQSQRLSALIAGTLTGLIGVCLLTLNKEGHDAVIDAIIRAVPLSREQAEQIIAVTEA